MYRPEAERAEEAKRDPLLRTRALLIDRGISTPETLDALEEEIKTSVAADADEAASHPQPAPETALQHVYSEDVDPAGPEFDSEDSPDFTDDRDLTVVDLLNACMRDELERDPRIVVFGEDVADASREEILLEVKGKGGVFKVTHGLQSRFGGQRVFNTPLAEASIVGRAIGMAQRGLKPVVEIQFFDYIWPAFMQIPERAGHHAIPDGWGLFSAGRDTRSVRGIPEGWRSLPLTDGGHALHSHTWPQGGIAVQRPGCQRAPENGHPL